MACFVLQNIAKDRNQPDFEDDFVENGDMFEIDESVSDGGIAGATSAREQSKIRRLGFETRTRIANTHFRC